uniref:SABATH methyltransferase 3 n=1 Tax=Bixa orellana TaxID=66672 RepID=A0A140CWV1_BIXOR|nr:SABATH methyltransferase 3 [Bixa orellana]
MATAPALTDLLRMNAENAKGGSSYASNSSLQKRVILKSRPVMEDSLKDMLGNRTFPSCIKVADLGCSSGPTAFMAVSEVIKIIYEICKEQNRKLPEFQVCLNDLAGNDFNAVFRSAPAFCEGLKRDMAAECYVSGVPGSFYDRIFPSNTLQFAHSSYSLHWLSQVPENLENNKRNIYIGKSSPPDVFKAYKEQFKKDFSKFLGLRSEEMTSGGRMVLSFMGRSVEDPTGKECCFMWEILSKSLLDLVSEGLVEEADVESFNLPFYTAYKGEVREIVEEEGSFAIDKLDSIELIMGNDVTLAEKSQRLARSARAVSEWLVANRFGNNIVDKLYGRFEGIAADKFSVENVKFVNIIVSMTKK